MRILEVLWVAPTLPAAPRREVRIGGRMPLRQASAEWAQDPGPAPLLNPACEYLIYVLRHGDGEGAPPNVDWRITGDQGVYRLDARSGGEPRYVFCGGGEPPLPRVLDPTAVRSRAFLG
ncbi:hypothetical protein OG792_19735 [Micromonospora sp. NBC_01699]|uniref:hypothetical protein n=1 Tax=Micromonospora sp. NBC_01699 TaxID=2975984 RepID=UPI002E2A70CB|nr:hypothetical protein [Micromonospora sp. NBC_01699]